MFKFLRITTYVVFLITHLSFAQDTLIILKYPSEKEVAVSVKSIVFRIGADLDYQYKVTSSPSSMQSVWDFSLIHRADVESLKAPVGWDAMIAPVPIERISWAASDSTRDIYPGSTLSGFRYLSRGIPSITDFYATGWVEPPVVEIEPDSIVGGVFPENSLHGSTIGPIDPPSPFVPLAFLDTLLSYTRQSAELGWLGKDRDNDCDDDERPEDGIVRNIEHRIQKAKRELTKGDSVQARKELAKLVQKVERIWKRSQEEEKKHRRDRWEKRDKVIMTSEAYALLKYNTEYLIERLPERSRHGRR